MSKSIQQRVQAAIDKREREARKIVDRANAAADRKLTRIDMKRDAEIEARMHDGQEFDSELGLWI